MSIDPAKRWVYKRVMSRRLPSKTDILALFGREDRALHPREIARELEVPEASYGALENVLDDMVAQGELGSRPGNKYKPRGRDGRRDAGAREEREGTDRKSVV